MNWEYGFTERAQRDLEQVDDGDRRRIFETLDRFVADPVRSGVNIQRIAGTQGDWRLRVGRWRLVFQYNRPSRLIEVIRVLPRNEATYRRRP